MVVLAVAITITVAGTHTLGVWKDDKEVDEKVEYPTEVGSLHQLKYYVKNGTNKICITNDIEISSPIYVTDDTVITAKTDVLIKRSSDYFGELFIIGEDADGYKTIYSGKNPKLTLGDGVMSGTVTIDGNSDVDALGSIFLIVSSGQLVMNDNVIIQNANKTGNEKLLNEKYITSSPENIGGAAVDIISGAFTMNGGVIKDCNAVTDTSQAYMGGAIYNYGDFNMYGGKITNCEANRGGAIYNYKTVHIHKGIIDNNYAKTYGAAICCANSQYVKVYMGEEGAKEETVLIDSNRSSGAGCALYSKQKCSLAIYGGTTFSNNESGSHGGAIYTAGDVYIKDAVFSENSCSSQGGAIQLHSVTDFTPREVTILDTHFIGNESKNGGAIYSVTEGPVRLFNCSFDNNTASTNGGTLWISGSNVSIKDIDASENTSVGKGGFLYLDGSSTVVRLTSGTIENNQADSGEFIYGKNASSTVVISNSLIYSGTKAGSFIEVLE